MNFSTRYAIQSIVMRRPWLLRQWVRIRPWYKHLIVTPETEVVIEGFPRCANSFAVVAFEMVQSRPVRIAHHLHAESQVLLGIRYGLPVLVLYREPLGAVTSLVTRHPQIGVKQALARYLNFYDMVKSVADNIVMADFSEVTLDYASIISQLNAKFGTSFTPYRNTLDRDREVFMILDKLNMIDAGGQVAMLARPSSAKSRLLQSRRNEIYSNPLYDKTLQLYHEIKALTEQKYSGEMVVT